MVIYVGDTHGLLDAFIEFDKYALKHGITDVIQVGDSGVSFAMGKNCPVNRYFTKRARQGRPGPTWWTCGGNHENYDLWEKWAGEQGDPEIVEIAPGFNWVRRGVTLTLGGKKHLFMGGAESTDRHLRLEGHSWWRQETPTYEEFCMFAAGLEQKPDVVVTHDAPLRVDIWRYNREVNPTPRNLEGALKVCEHTPPLWVFGHHHMNQVWDIDGTKFVCCGLNGEGWCPVNGRIGRFIV